MPECVWVRRLLDPLDDVALCALAKLAALSEDSFPVGKQRPDGDLDSAHMSFLLRQQPPQRPATPLPELPRRWLAPRGAVGFLDTHRDVVIAVAAVVAAFGAVVGAVAGGIAGSHPHYHVLTGGFMITAYVLFAVASVILLVLFGASVASAGWRRNTRSCLAALISAGYGLYWQELDEAGLDAWYRSLADWNERVRAMIKTHLDEPSVVVFDNDVDAHMSAFDFLDAPNPNDSLSRARRARLTTRIQNLHRLMGGV